MKLATYGITFATDLNDKYSFLRQIYNAVLINDPNWFFVLHPGGITLRCSPNKTMKVEKLLKKEMLVYKKDRHYYQPFKHEYYGVHILGDDIVPLFHAMAVIFVKYGPHMSFKVAMERFNHIFVNMRGVHDFYKEALYYLRLAEGRADLINKNLPHPQFLYKFVYWIKKQI